MKTAPEVNVAVSGETKLYWRSNGASILYQSVAAQIAAVGPPSPIEVLVMHPDLSLAWSPPTVLVCDEASTVTLRTQRKREVNVWTDGTVSVFAPEAGVISIPVSDALNRIVPVVSRVPDALTTVADDPRLGWLIGAFISDGWVTEGHLAFTKANPAIRQHFLDLWFSWTGNPRVYKEYSTIHSITDNVISGESTKVHITFGSPRGLECAIWLSRHCYHEDVTQRGNERICLYKRLPPVFLDFSRRMRLAILAGLIDGDGSVSLNKSRAKPQVVITFASSSPYLAEDVPILLASLGIKCGLSVTRPKAGRLQSHDSYTISLSTPDVQALMEEIPLVTKYKAWTHLRENPPRNNDRDVVPLWPAVARHIREKVQWTAESKPKRNSLAGPCGPSSVCKLIARSSAEWYVENVSEADDLADMKRFREIVANRDIGWDRIVEVTPAESQPVYGLSLPPRAAMALTNGLVV